MDSAAFCCSVASHTVVSTNICTMYNNVDSKMESVQCSVQTVHVHLCNIAANSFFRMFSMSYIFYKSKLRILEFLCNISETS
jgi:hypothetical protein